jgi:hypothetical protein
MGHRRSKGVRWTGREPLAATARPEIEEASLSHPFAELPLGLTETG